MVYTPQGNTGIDASLTRWPVSAAYALNEWPGKVNVGLAGSGCTPCPSSTWPQRCARRVTSPLTRAPAATLGYSDPRWTAAGGVFINAFGISKYNCKCVPRACLLQCCAALHVWLWALLTSSDAPDGPRAPLRPASARQVLLL